MTQRGGGVGVAPSGLVSSFDGHVGAVTLANTDLDRVRAIVSKTANYTAADGDYVVGDTTGGAFTVTLPAAVAGGYIVVELRTGSPALTVHNLLGGDVILTGARAGALCFSDGTNWHAIVSEGSGTYPSPKTAPELAANYSYDMQVELRDQLRRSKGGWVGTGGVGAVALRFDHHSDSFASTVLPLLQARGMPAGFCMMTDMTRGGDNNQSWATLAGWVKNSGIEMWQHSYDHLSPTGYTTGASPEVWEIVTAMNDMQVAIGSDIKIQGWMHPGTGSQADYDGALNTFASLDTPTGRLLRRVHPISEGQNAGAVRLLPTGPVNGLGHTSGDAPATLAGLKQIVDICYYRRIGTEVLFHSVNIGTVNGLSLVDFTAFLDYIQTYRNNEQLAVVTPSGLYFADPYRARGPDLLAWGDFEQVTNANQGPWDTFAGGVSVINDGSAFRGNQYLNVPSPQTTQTVVTQGSALQIDVANMGIGGETFVMEAMFRPHTTAAAGRMQIRDSLNSAALNIDVTFATMNPGTTWTKFRQPFTIPVSTASLVIGVGRGLGGAIDIDEVHCWKV